MSSQSFIMSSSLKFLIITFCFAFFLSPVVAVSLSRCNGITISIGFKISTKNQCRLYCVSLTLLFQPMPCKPKLIFGLFNVVSIFCFI